MTLKLSRNIHPLFAASSAADGSAGTAPPAATTPPSTRIAAGNGTRAASSRVGTGPPAPGLAGLVTAEALQDSRYSCSEDQRAPAAGGGRTSARRSPLAKERRSRGSRRCGCPPPVSRRPFPPPPRGGAAGAKRRDVKSGTQRPAASSNIPTCTTIGDKLKTRNRIIRRTRDRME
jgi:hypothetical protein